MVARCLRYKVHHLLTVDRATLINYVLNFTNYSRNPLSVDMVGIYNSQKWSRVTTAHGQTLLSLAFNYGVLSMMTLTLGTETLNVELEDWPRHCFDALGDRQKVGMRIPVGISLGVPMGMGIIIMELTATCCIKLRLSLYFQIQT